MNAASRRELVSTRLTGEWRHYPRVELPSPVLALLTGPDSLWAGGFGGVACYSDADGWTPCAAGLALRAVTALTHHNGSLLAGGEGGIARSVRGGKSWRQCSVPDGVGTVTGLGLSPRFREDGTGLATTLDSGMLRSTDSGQSWQASSFGLQSLEVLAVAWGTGETVVAATSTSLVRSPNAGRAWRPLPSTAGTAFVALAAIGDGEMLAAPDVGPLLRSSQNLTTWSSVAALPLDVRTSALLSFGAGRLLVGTADHGILLSTDDGATWSTVSGEIPLSFACDETRVFAGTASGVLQSQDRGETWSDFPPPPLHDLYRILLVDGLPLLSGINSPPVIYDAASGWIVLTAVPQPLGGLFQSPQGVLFASTPDGLYQSDDHGGSWQAIVPGSAGCVTQMTFAAEGRGWAGMNADGALLRTRNGGRSWERLSAPFGVLPLVALLALSSSLIAATYDERRRAVCIWRSEDDGERWVRGADTFTPWPVVATCPSPPVVTVGSVVAVQQPDRAWHRTAVGETGIRRVVGNGTVLFALAGDGLWHSEDHGVSWFRDDMDLPPAQVADIALDGESLYALLAGGRLWSRQIQGGH
jgi:photosystem II stability/assembly factor-like uncharacterized protein